MEEFYTRKEIRELLKVKSDAIILRLEKEHKLNPLRFERTIRYPASEITAIFGIKPGYSESEFIEANAF